MPTFTDIINNPLVDALTRGAIGAVREAASKTSNDMSQPAVSAPAAADDIRTAMVKEVQKSPELQHITNTEHWYQKRSRWSAIIGIAFSVIAPVAAYYGLPVGDAEKELAVTVVSGIGGLWAAYLAYRAGTATKPLGA